MRRKFLLQDYEHMLIINCMARPKKCRLVGCSPGCYYFKPRGIPLFRLQEITLSLDELETLRLADEKGLYQEDGASRMGVSRATFGRILKGARQKVAEAILQGKALRVGLSEEVDIVKNFMKKGGSCETTEVTEKDFVSSKRISVKSETP
jgi:predicted DNA-binding protein (UPF0251 family)